jgi:hypothetical protein
MANIDEMKGTISARLSYEEDFTFEKKKEELAQLVRSDVAPRISAILDSAPVHVSIDSDGDIAGSSKDFYIYLTGTSLSCSASSVLLASLSTSDIIEKLPRVIAELHRIRSPYLKPVYYGARLFASFWYPSAQSNLRLRERYFVPFQQLLGAGAGAVATAASCSYSFATGVFSDTANFESKGDQVTARIMRDGDASKFANFNEFWFAAKIEDEVRWLAQFFEPLEREGAMKSLGSLFGSPTDKSQ